MDTFDGGMDLESSNDKCKRKASQLFGFRRFSRLQ
jgi:hypothetical protein